MKTLPCVCDPRTPGTHTTDCKNWRTTIKELDWMATNPDWISPYVDGETWSTPYRSPRGFVTTWMGVRVGVILSVGFPCGDGFSLYGKRRYIRFRLFTGQMYGGWLTDAKQFVNARRLKEDPSENHIPDPREDLISQLTTTRTYVKETV